MFTETERHKVFETLGQLDLEGRINIGIKKLIMMCEMARQDIDKVEKFISVIRDECRKISLRPIVQ